MKSYRVRFSARVTLHDTVVRARDHNEAFEQALLVTGTDFDEVDRAAIEEVKEQVETHR